MESTKYAITRARYANHMAAEAAIPKVLSLGRGRGPSPAQVTERQRLVKEKFQELQLIRRATDILREDAVLPVKRNIIKEYLLENRDKFQGSMYQNQHTAARIKMLNADFDKNYSMLMSGWKIQDRDTVPAELERKFKEAYPHANWNAANSCVATIMSSRYREFWPAGAEWDSYKGRLWENFVELDKCMYDSEVKGVEEEYIKDNLDRKVAELKREKNNIGPLINLRKPKEIVNTNLLKFEPTKAGLASRTSELSGLFNSTVHPAGISSLQANAIRAAGNSNNLRGGVKKSRRNRNKKTTRKIHRKH